MADKLLTAVQLAGALGLTESAVIRLRKQRKIPAVKLGYRTFRFRLPSVEAALGKLELKAISARTRDEYGPLSPLPERSQSAYRRS
jgi:predicted DNA-binding transcriptional regulator AlpA